MFAGPQPTSSILMPGAGFRTSSTYRLIALSAPSANINPLYRAGTPIDRYRPVVRCATTVLRKILPNFRISIYGWALRNQLCSLRHLTRTHLETPPPSVPDQSCRSGRSNERPEACTQEYNIDNYGIIVAHRLAAEYGFDNGPHTDEPAGIVRRHRRAQLIACG